MRLTQTHLRYWQQRKAPNPSWAQGLIGNADMRVSIDACVNAHAGLSFKSEPHNSLNLLRRERERRGNRGLAEMLKAFLNSHTYCGPRRSANAKKWIARMKR